MQCAAPLAAKSLNVRVVQCKAVVTPAVVSPMFLILCMINRVCVKPITKMVLTTSLTFVFEQLQSIY